MLDPFADPTAQQFRALARSSPWRWSTLEYERSVFDGKKREHGFLRRPGQLRVESLDGIVQRVQAAAPPSSRSWFSSSGDSGQLARRWPAEMAPVLDADGLVLERPTEQIPSFYIDYDAPFNNDYHWIATLDPVELADGRDGAAGPPVELQDIRAVSHHGRPAWEALARPTVRYAPRCDCCPLLEGYPDEENNRWVPWGVSLVRLDVRTGICVYVQHAAGEYPVLYPNGELLMHDHGVRTGLDFRVIAVDEPMDNALFHVAE